MKKQDALRMKPGDRIRFGQSMWSERCDAEGGWREGTVVHVTPAGGIKVKTGGGTRWVPYHHAVRI